MAEDLVWKGRRINSYAIRGVVLDNNHSSTTQVYSSGGGQVTPGSTYVSPVTVSSVVTTKQRFWLRTADGREQQIELTNVEVPLRSGQEVSVLAAMCQGQDRGRVFGFVNHTAGTSLQVLRGSELDKQVGFGPAFSVSSRSGLKAAVAFAVLTVVAAIAKGAPAEGFPIYVLLGLLLGLAFDGFRGASERRKAVDGWVKRTIPTYTA